MDKPQDFHKPITIVLAGTGSASMEHIDAAFENLILSGLPHDGDRYVRVLVPFDEPTSGIGVTRAIEWLTDVLPAEEMTGVVWSPSKMVAKMKVTIKAEEGIYTPLSALEFALNAAAGHLNESEVFFFSFYDPEKETDLEQIRVAKNYRGIRTVNVCLAGVDVFENYESTEETLAREKAEAEFAAQVAEETAKAPAKKAVAKKAAAPRKKAAPKVLVAEDVPLLPEPQTAIQTPSEAIPVGTVVEVAGIPFVKKHEHLCALGDTHAGDCRINISITEAEAKSLTPGLDALISDRVSKEEEDRRIRDSLAIFKPDADSIPVKKEDLLRLLDVLTDIVKGMQ